MERITVFDGKFWAHKNFPPVKDDTVDEFVDCVKELAARLAAYEETGLEPEELAQAEKKGRLVVLPRLHGKKLLRDGLEFEPNHWNITLTAFAHNQPTKSGKRVGLFSICEAAEAALDAMGGENNA